MAEASKSVGGRDIRAEADRRLEELAANPYPGRGIVIGRTATGDVAHVYWVMGRSPNSRNRLLEVYNAIVDGEQAPSVRTVPFDESKVEDPSLIIYNAMRQRGKSHVVTNGKHTDTIIDGMALGHSFVDSLMTERCEPDGPNWTSRISGITTLQDQALPFVLSVIKSSDMYLGSGGQGHPASEHRFWGGDLSRFMPGVGATVQTYKSDGSPLPSFEEAPYPLPLGEGAADTANMIWDHLDHDNRVALVVKTMNRETGVIDIEVRNQLEVQEAA